MKLLEDIVVETNNGIEIIRENTTIEDYDEEIFSDGLPDFVGMSDADISSKEDEVGGQVHRFVDVVMPINLDVTSKEDFNYMVSEIRKWVKDENLRMFEDLETMTGIDMNEITIENVKITRHPEGGFILTVNFYEDPDNRGKFVMPDLDVDTEHISDEDDEQNKIFKAQEEIRNIRQKYDQYKKDIEEQMESVKSSEYYNDWQREDTLDYLENRLKYIEDWYKSKTSEVKNKYL